MSLVGGLETRPDLVMVVLVFSPGGLSVGAEGTTCALATGLAALESAGSVVAEGGVS